MVLLGAIRDARTPTLRSIGTVCAFLNVSPRDQSSEDRKEVMYGLPSRWSFWVMTA